MTGLIQKALETATETKDIIFGNDVNKEIGPMFKRLYPNMKAIVVADDNTWGAVGEEVVKSLEEAEIGRASCRERV